MEPPHDFFVIVGMDAAHGFLLLTRSDLPPRWILFCSRPLSGPRREFLWPDCSGRRRLFDLVRSTVGLDDGLQRPPAAVPQGPPVILSGCPGKFRPVRRKHFVQE